MPHQGKIKGSEEMYSVLNSLVNTGVTKSVSFVGDMLPLIVLAGGLILVEGVIAIIYKVVRS